MTARLPPAAKLSLSPAIYYLSSSRFSPVKEEYELKREGFEKELSDLLGAPWTFDFNPLAIYPYAESQHFAKDQPGIDFRQYAEGVLTSFKAFIETYGDAAKKELNDVGHAHQIQLDVAMAYQLEVLGFGTDDMLREGFNESAESGVVKVGIVDALKRQRDCEVEIKDGVLYLQPSKRKNRRRTRCGKDERKKLAKMITPDPANHAIRQTRHGGGVSGV
ncbi:hypothetical protein DFH08DRAFT_810306 [Mycena albidolilacea]|uniref:Uncharacterized protein n=1 Tax=Mycena albidolilacea TaxID=1033008 RepID=A0AAD6ZXU8_9AGAR|nr:hypothetical protein DFH08DRAFT_810306 [Mycena albidolilacea]